MATIVDYRKLRGEIQEALTKLPPEVVKAAYEIAPDDVGETAIFFYILLKDDATEGDEVLFDATSRVRRAINEYLQPLENWGLFPFFSFRAASEQQRDPKPAW